MNKKNAKLVFYLVFTVFLTLGLSVSFQSLLAAWTSPPEDPPDGNVSKPIYASSTASQTTDNSLVIIGDLSAGNVYASGRIGIGDNSPAETLELNTNSGLTTRLRITDHDAGQNPEIQLHYDSTANGHWGIYDHKGDGNKLTIWGGGNNNMTLDLNGNLWVRGAVTAGGGMGGWTRNTGVSPADIYTADSGDQAGIGTQSPDRKLEILDAANPQLRLTQTDSTAYADLHMNVNGDLVMNVDNRTNQLVLDNGGNVGIGDASPSSLFTVGSGDLLQINSSGIVLGPNGAVGNPSYSFVSDTNSGLYSGGLDIIHLATAGANRLSIIANGNVGVGTENPGIAKMNIVNQGNNVGLYIGDVNRAPYGQAMLEINPPAGATHIWASEAGTKVFSVTSGGAVSASSYCDQNGANCKNITGMGGVNNNVVVKQSAANMVGTSNTSPTNLWGISAWLDAGTYLFIFKANVGGTNVGNYWFFINGNPEHYARIRYGMTEAMQNQQYIAMFTKTLSSTANYVFNFMAAGELAGIYTVYAFERELEIIKLY